jgi:transcription initiation factor TFIIIB Brf1 subunit/transcription initiation factor TFIIB
LRLDKTTIQVSLNTKIALSQIKGELLVVDGKNRTFDDVIRDLIFYWKTGKKRDLNLSIPTGIQFYSHYRCCISLYIGECRGLVESSKTEFWMCNHPWLVTDSDRGEIACPGCGLVLEERIIDPSFPSYRLKSRYKYPSRPKPKGTLPSEKPWIRPRKERNFVKAKGQLDLLSDRMHIPPSVKRNAENIYRRAANKGLLKGRKVSNLLAAAIYVSCRQNHVPRTTRAIAKYLDGVSKKDLDRCCRLLVFELELKMPNSDPTIYISQLAGETGISEVPQGLAAKMLKQARRHCLIGKDPVGLAAAALYLALTGTNGKTTQKELAEAGGITDFTVRKSCQVLKAAIACMQTSRAKIGRFEGNDNECPMSTLPRCSATI